MEADLRLIERIKIIVEMCHNSNFFARYGRKEGNAAFWQGLPKFGFLDFCLRISTFGLFMKLTHSVMEKQSNLERLSGYIILIGVLAIVGVACWYFKDVLVYIILAFIVSLLSRPLMHLFQKVHIKGKSAPDWLSAIVSILIVILGLVLMVTQVIPIMVSIIREASFLSDMKLLDNHVTDNINGWVTSTIPASARITTPSASSSTI